MRTVADILELEELELLAETLLEELSETLARIRELKGGRR